MAPTIEDLVLQHDRRGISALRPFLPNDFCHQAAQLILDHPGPAFLVTGFYIVSANAPETDGPPGAIALGRALSALGYPVAYVTDRFALTLMQSEERPSVSVVDFPITEPEESKRFAQRLLAELGPSLIIAIERCGTTRDDSYRNIRGIDITPFCARVDYLFSPRQKTIGIGDGGNEIGMGNLKRHIPRIPSLVPHPAVTKVTRLVLASVSNWGAYGVIAALSRLVGRNLLPSPQEQEGLIQEMVRKGAVDGVTGKRETTVDTFSLQENLAVLEQLHRLVG